MGYITCKYGGSSLADATCLKGAANIIDSNSDRRYIVPSAPGKRHPNDIKVTDLLYTWHNLVRQGLDASQPVQLVTERYKGLAQELGLNLDVQGELDLIAAECPLHEEPDYMASRGEYLNGLLLAELLRATFVDPLELIKFDNEGLLDPVSYELMGQALAAPGRYVIPGFYGSWPDGKVKTFSRGGSDITGAIVARATNSRLYENWTDVSGFRMADPHIVPNAKYISEITYQELRELAYMGANVLHDEAIFPVREPGIPINILNTRAPEEPGTLIVAKREPKTPVCGIAGQRGFTMINVEKTLMNRELGFGRRVLSVLEEHGVSFEHMPSSIDTMSIILKDDELANHGPSVVKGIERTCEPDNVYLTSGLALVATVGQDMAGRIGMAARLTGACARTGVNLRVLDQGSSENNIIIGVEERDLEKAVLAIHNEFAEVESEGPA
ncbi:MAG: aspartate kinase [Candidatus Hydrogenedentota bacterium]